MSVTCVRCNLGGFYRCELSGWKIPARLARLKFRSRVYFQLRNFGAEAFSYQSREMNSCLTYILYMYTFVKVGHERCTAGPSV